MNPEHLTASFEETRPHLRAVASRMLGSPSAAEDAVQEAWLRLNRSDTSGVKSLPAWLTTVVSRICLDTLRSRKGRREEEFDPEMTDAEGALGADTDGDPEQTLIRSDQMGLALETVLDTLEPAERVAFVLHDMFDMSFDDIAPIVSRTPIAARKLASRARLRLKEANERGPTDQTRRREVIGAFLAASRQGDFAALLVLLDPTVVLRADTFAIRMGASAEVQGAMAVAETFKGRAKVAQLATLDEMVGAVWSAGGEVRVAFSFTLNDGRITAIDLLADPDHLKTLSISLL